MIGIIGNGFVGNAVYQSVRDKVKTYVYDVDSNRSLNKYEETVKQKLVFVCLPTPMRMDGSCDLSLLDEFFANAPEYDFDEDTNPTYIIKSTVPIGTTRSYSDRYCKTIVHNPEFLTARNAVNDFKEQKRIIIGSKDYEGNELAQFYRNHWYDVDIISMSSDESEAVKYFSNTFLAYKVAYFNKIYDVCQKAKLDYDKVRRGIVSDERIGESHSEVPGIDNDRGFGGTCFPKDINALIVQMESFGVDASMLREVWKYNQEIRTLIDWHTT
tara:strand:+ start:4613 stop:5422 length:810 start_codon:yes stop_codon:yes gene_type:complete